MVASKIKALLSKEQKRKFLVLSLLLVIVVLFEMIGVGLVIPILIFITSNQISDSFPNIALMIHDNEFTQFQLVSYSLLLLLIIYTIKTMLLAYISLWQSRFVYAVQAELSQKLFESYMGQPYTFHLQRNSSQLIRNLTTEVGHFTGVVLASTSLISELMILTGISLLLLYVEPLGTVVIICILAAASCSFFLAIRDRLENWGKARQYHEGKRIQHIQEGLGGIKEIKMLCREKNFLRHYHVHNKNSAEMGKLQNFIQSLPRLWLEWLSVVVMISVVMTMLISGKSIDLIVPTLGLFAVAAFKILPSINKILSSVQKLKFTLPVIDLLYKEMMAINKTIYYPNEVNNLFDNWDYIKIEGLTFKYPGSIRNIINNLTFKIKKGQTIAIVGGSGVGKSTLVDIILGLLEPISGKITVGNKDIHNNLRVWQSKIGYVPQDIYLTDDTLRNNIAFGLQDDDIDEKMLNSSIESAQLSAFVSSLPLNSHSKVGENGIGLSGGQKQRVGIARALYNNPELLVFDESTSSLDSATENEIMQTIKILHGYKTIIIITHNAETVKCADTVYNIAA